MEAIGLVGRLNALHPDGLVQLMSNHVVDPYILRVPPGSSLPLSIPHRFAVTWLLLYVGSIILYLACSALDYGVILLLRRVRRYPDQNAGKVQIAQEIKHSLRSLIFMSGLSVPLEVGIQLGYSKVYHNVHDYSLAYFFLSPVLFVIVSDCVIYWIHRGLHVPSVYRVIHKPHHSYVYTTAFAAFAFHPLDGFSQGIPYQIFVYLFPFHAGLHLIFMVLVLLWTINIHDRASLFIPGVNGAAHHTIHHTTYRSNYGQYLTLWDKVFGTFRDPRIWSASGSPTLTERQVYGAYVD